MIKKIIKHLKQGTFIKRVSLLLKIYFLSLKYRYGRATPVVAITFDDGCETDYTVAYPLMEKRGIKGTTYITTAWIEARGRKLTWEQINRLKQSGWIIGCHTHTHPRLTELKAENIHKEMRDVNQAFKLNGIEPPVHHAYPLGAYNDLVVDVIRNYRKTGRAPGGGTPLDYHSSDLYLLPANEPILHNEQDLIETKKQIDKGLPLILVFHELREEPGTWDSHPHYFEKLLDYFLEKNIKTATIQDIYNLMHCEASIAQS